MRAIQCFANPKGCSVAARVAGLCVLALAIFLSGCASLPDTSAILDRHAGQQTRFESARGPVSERRSAAILARLQRNTGELDILDRHIALEEAISDNPLTLGNRVTLLEDGEETYAAMFDAIRAARDHIHLQSYIIEDDAVGQRFADLLLQKQAEGVQVNLIYDSVGAIQTPRAYFDRLRAGGIQVLEFNPVNPLALRVAWRIYNRDHRKLLITDGKVAFLGGINISGVYSTGSALSRSTRSGGSAKAKGWRDTHMRVEGPVVADLQRLFLATWKKQNGPPPADRNYFPTLFPAGADIVRVIGSSPDDPYSQMYMALISAIHSAEKQIWITNAYFVPDPQLLDALCQAPARGVDVRLLLPSHSDFGVVLQASRSNYDRLLACGVRIFEREEQLLHAKTVVIDGVWSTVGSTNLDWRSFLDNDELDAIMLGREFGSRMQEMFQRDLEKSREIDATRWAERPAGARFKEWFSRLWQRLL